MAVISSSVMTYMLRLTEDNRLINLGLHDVARMLVVADMDAAISALRLGRVVHCPVDDLATLKERLKALGVQS